MSHDNAQDPNQPINDLDLTPRELVAFLNELNTQVRVVDGQQVNDLVHSSVASWPQDGPMLTVLPTA
jgi:hypothetical protein